MMGFTTKQVAAFTQLTNRQLNYFDTTGLLSPSVQSAQGRGTYRLYAFRDVVALRLIAKLRQQGVSLQAIRKAVDYLRTMEQAALSASILAVNGDDVVLVDRNQLAISLLKQPGQLCFLIDVGGITREVEEAIRAVG
ncbi:MAG: MerR family transcriptional regulator [Sulfobacillus benefaciens]|uniref:MerR family transcriptional regulator n=1 Tax=Sulfobacillus benefaciens TaxID=453960 RepID=A0A2T2WUV0_9FIRM|nr:MAG: MerR family transcriptional regulator [Sulfobacillus benefaciens]